MTRKKRPLIRAYAPSGPSLGKPVLDPMPLAQWSLPGLNQGAS